MNEEKRETPQHTYGRKSVQKLSKCVEPYWPGATNSEHLEHNSEQ